ncbi:unnamed protein product [Closterium sp. Yama58-4]|nr:unnamed protein product [Closterium sp. Yama58-4]
MTSADKFPPSRSATAAFRAITVTTAQQFALLSQPSSPANSASSSPARGNAAGRSAGASHVPPPPSRFESEAPLTASDCVAQQEKNASAVNDAASDAPRQSAQLEPPSTEPASHGLSLHQLQHLVALTATNDSPRDTSSPSAFPYARSESSRDVARDRRSSRLSLDSAQRRLDSWNRVSKPLAHYSHDSIGAQHRRLKRSGSEPALATRGFDGESDGGSARLLRPLDALVSEARQRVSRHSLRRSRSAHALGEKDRDALWNDAMNALFWRRGGAVIYRRPEGATPSSPQTAGPANKCDCRGCGSRRQISLTKFYEDCFLLSPHLVLSLIRCRFSSFPVCRLSWKMMRIASRQFLSAGKSLKAATPAELAVLGGTGRERGLAASAASDTSRPIVASLPDLPYDYGALEPVVSGEIMQLHHAKHHAAYVAGYNKAVEQLDAARGKGDTETVVSLQRAINFNGGGHVNHSIFWKNLAPISEGGGAPPEGPLAAAIDAEFGSLDALVSKFNAAGAGVQGSGWVWLGLNDRKKLAIVTTANQDACVTTGHVPLLGVDVWEHAYYLQYKNVRPDYLKNIWKIINWKDVASRYAAAT